MKKPFDQRTHKRNVDADRAKMTDTEKRASACARSKSRRKARVALILATALANKKSPAEQLKALDFRLGLGVGAKRERAHLTALISS